MKKTSIIPLNVPNILSIYRLVSFPVIAYIAIQGYERLFFWMLLINFITDILDGLIARTFNLQTKIGAKIDSIADFGTYLLVFLGIYLFKADDFLPHIVSFSIFIGLFIFAHVLSLIKFGRMPSFHLYSWKIGGYIQGIFFIVLFSSHGFITAFYYFMLIWGGLAFLEHITIQLMISEMISNAKGLYWVLKSRKTTS
jgi:cardiolipin synthase